MCKYVDYGERQRGEREVKEIHVRMVYLHS